MNPTILTDEQRQRFRDDGYVAVPGFFAPDELAVLRGELARLRADGRLRNVVTAGDGRTPANDRANLQICPISPVNPTIRALHHAPRVIGAVGELIGHPLRFVLDQIFCKPARAGAGTAWHQDVAYWPAVAERTRGTGVWIALDDATVANGTMHVVPRSHRSVLPHRRDPHSDHHIRAEDPADAVAIELPAGGALFFNFGVLHCTRDNRTDRDRAGLALHFIAESARPPGMFEDPWNETISDPAGRPLAPATWAEARTAAAIA